jgi:predicted enzyme related to lactoylglutathione lyase
MPEKLSKDTNALNWFEIPVTDTARAKKFYETILDVSMEQADMMGMEMVMFPYDEAPNGKVSGALVKSEYHKPSADGTLIYLNANPSIQDVQDRIAAAGGNVIMPRTLISEMVGYMAFFIDTEGNRIGLHASN